MMDTGKKQDLRRGRSGPPSACPPVVPLASPHSLPHPHAHPPSPIQPYFFCSPMYVSDSKYPSQFNLCPSHLPSQNLSHVSATSRRRASARPLRVLSKLCDLLSLWCMCVRVCPLRPGMVNLAPTSTGSATAIAEVTPGGQPGPGSGPGPEPGPPPPFEARPAPAPRAAPMSARPDPQRLRNLGWPALRATTRGRPGWAGSGPTRRERRRRRRRRTRRSFTSRRSTATTYRVALRHRAGSPLA